MKARFSTERLLPFAAIAGALLLIGSEFLDTFRFDGAGETTLAVSGGGHRHHYALLVLGLFAIAAVVVALTSGSKPAAVAVAAVGVTALLIFLVVDLPDVDKVGTFDDPAQTFLQAKAQPQDGFWIELIGALVLTVCGGAMATLTPEQLRSLRPGATSKARESLPSRGGRLEPLLRRPAKSRDASPAKRPAESKPARRGRAAKARAETPAAGKGSKTAKTKADRTRDEREAERTQRESRRAKGAVGPEPNPRGKPPVKPAAEGEPKAGSKQEAK